MVRTRSAWLLVCFDHDNSKVARRSTFDRADMSSAPGFTLIEVLVTISIIAVLVGLAIPSLRGTKQAADTLSRHNDMRQLHLSATMYAGDFKNFFPFLGVPGKPLEPLTVGGTTMPPFPIGGSMGLFHDSSLLWISPLDPYLDGGARMYDGRIDRKLTGDWRDVFVPTVYQLTHTAFAAPRYWSQDHDSTRGIDPTPPAPPASLIHGTRHDQIRFPARKGIIIDLGDPRFSTYPSDALFVHSVVFGDGSTRDVRAQEFEPYLKKNVDRPHGANSGVPTFCTRDGLEGVDTGTRD